MASQFLKRVKAYFHPYLLPLKALYFFQIGSTACLIPYFPLFILHLGLNSAELGIIYGILPSLSMLSKPLAGFLVDKFYPPTVIRIFTAIELIFMSALYFVPKITPLSQISNMTCEEFDFLRPVGNYSCHALDYEDHQEFPAYFNSSFAIPMDIVNTSSCNCSFVTDPSVVVPETFVRWTMQFWLTGLLLMTAWIGYGSIFTSGDALAFRIVDNSPVPSTYGSNRVFGTFGYAGFALLMGFLLNGFSSTVSTDRDFTPAFATFGVAVCCGLVVTLFLKAPKNTTKRNPDAAIASAMSMRDLLTTEVLLFWLGSLVVGIMTGLLYAFLGVHIAELGGSNLLLGVIPFIDCLCEAPMMACSAWVIRKLGYHACMVLAMSGFAARFIGYALIEDPWYFLIVEVTHAITFGLIYPTMNSFAFEKAPSGAAGRLQGLLMGTYDGFGQGIGVLAGGFLYYAFGGRTTWLGYGLLSALTGVSYAVFSVILWKRRKTSMSMDVESLNSVHLN